MISALRASSTLSPPANITEDKASASLGLFCAMACAKLLANAMKLSFFAIKSVSQFTSTSAPTLPSVLIKALTKPSAATREAALLALTPLLMRSSSSAALKSPSVSTSAFLQSIMPRPVASRRSFTIPAVISAIFHSFRKHNLKKRGSRPF